MNIEDRVINSVKGVLDKRPEVTLDSRLLEDLLVDSLDKLMVLSAIEDEFGIEIEEEFADVHTVKDIVVKLKARGF